MDSAIIRILFLVMCVHVCTAVVIINVSTNSEGDIVLTCSVDGAYQQPVQWSTNRTGSSAAITGGDDFTQFEVLVNNTLIIREVTAPYHGYYFCTHAMSGLSYTARIRKAPFLQIARHPLGNGDLLLTCLVNEMTTIPVTWLYRPTRNTTSMELQGGGDGEHVQVLTNNTLIVRDFDAQDVGQYTCRATDDGLTKIATANVTLAVRRATITFTTYQDDNYHFFITCIVNGIPALPSNDIIWSYSEDREDRIPERILPGGEESELQILENSTLLIREYSPEEDSGRYYCNAKLADGTRRRVPIDVGGGPLSTVASVWLIALVSIITLIQNAS